MEISKITWLMVKIIRLFKIVLPVSFYLLSISLNAQIIERKEYPVIIDFEKVIKAKPISYSWGSWGSNGLISGEMDQVLKSFGKFADSSINYFRTHNLLDLISIENIESETPHYNYEKLDVAISNLVANNLSLLFVLMGDPKINDQSYFNDFKDRKKLMKYKNFIYDLATHLEEKFGKAEVRKWYFQTLNEPDVRSPWKDDNQSFLNYYDACSEGLREADPKLRFGGPETAIDLSNIFRGLLRHCETGINYFTGEKGVRLDFVSVHAKGLPNEIMNREIKIVNYIKDSHSSLENVPFMNDEADPLSGWRVPYWWRPGSWFAAFVVQNHDLHLRVLQDRLKVDYLLLGNDNAYLGQWHQRTTHARLNNQKTLDENLYIPKPSFLVFHLINQLHKNYVYSEVPKEISSHFGVIASKNKESAILLLYNKTETQIETGKTPKETPDLKDLQAINNQQIKARLRLSGINAKKVNVQEYLIDNNHCNPFETWRELGSPNHLDPVQTKLINESALIPLVENKDYNIDKK